MKADIDILIMEKGLEIANQMAIKIANDESTRLAEEKTNNVLRLIDYNNRRIMQGLRPVDYPEDKT